jgi:VWFA-related protein
MTALGRAMLPRSLRASIQQPGFVLLLLCWLAAGTIVSAQQQQPTAPPSAETSSNVSSIGVITHLVEVNVIVNDKHGNPITGLTKDDFVLLDNKRPQEIQLLSAETNLRRDQPQTPLPPDTFTNRLSEQAGVPTGVTVILLDALNTEFAEQALTRKQVLKFLEHLRQQDRIALYWLGNNLYVLNDFTADVASLRDAIARSKRRVEPGPRRIRCELSSPEQSQPLDSGRTFRKPDPAGRPSGQRLTSASRMNRPKTAYASR